MDNYLILVCQIEGLKVQEFSLPLKIESVESWSGLYNLEFFEINLQKSLFQDIEEKKMIVDSKPLYLSDLKPLKTYFIAGIEIPPLLSVPITQVSISEETIKLFQDITELDKEMCKNYLEIYHSETGPNIEVKKEILTF